MPLRGSEFFGVGQVIGLERLNTKGNATPLQFFFGLLAVVKELL
jgi:hypothetical protein